MRNKNLLMAAGVFLAATAAHAAVVVDGVGAGGNYATLQEAIDAVLSSPSETEIRIAANSLPAGGTIPEGTTLTRSLTIRAAAGFTYPTIQGRLKLTPDNEDTTISLVGIKVAPGASNTDALVACGAISAYDCIFAGGSGVSCGVLCSTKSYGTTGRIDLTSCTMSGWFPMVAGRSIQNYSLTDCKINTEVNIFQTGIIHFGNQPIDRGSGPGLGAPISGDGVHTTATAPRRMVLNRCTVRAGRTLGWPPPLDGFPQVYQNFAGSLGTLEATNCMFYGLVEGSPAYLGWYDLPAETQNYKFTHCTFHQNQVICDVAAPASSTTGSLMNVNFTNTLFDIPNAAAAAICVYQHFSNGWSTGTLNLSGNANAYQVPPFAQHPAFNMSPYTRILIVDGNPPDGVFPTMPAFETNYYESIAEAADQFVVDTSMHLTDPLGVNLCKDRAVAVVPPVQFDFELERRPGGTLNDIGAQEVGGVSQVQDWTVY